MSFDVRFATFNMGQGSQDFWAMLPQDEKVKYQAEVDGQLKQSFTSEELENPGDRLEDMRAVQRQAEQTIIDRIEISVAERLADQCDVIALQEMMNDDRAFIRTLKEKGFLIYSRTIERNNPSAAVALRANMFVNGDNCSISSKSGKAGVYGQEIAAVTATHKDSNVKLTFSSLHSWGFQLYNPDQAYDQEIQDVKNNDPNVRKGVAYTKEAFNNLPNRSLSMLAGDMNNNPQNQPEQFKFIERQGFEVLEPDQITNVNRGDLDYIERKIDFIFVPKKSLFQRVCSFVSSFFASTVSLTHSSAKVLEGFDYTFEGNCSDHKPLATTITVTVIPSKISRFSSYIYNKIFS